MARIDFNLDDDVKKLYKLQCVRDGIDMAEDLRNFINDRIGEGCPNNECSYPRSQHTHLPPMATEPEEWMCPTPDDKIPY